MLRERKMIKQELLKQLIGFICTACGGKNICFLYSGFFSDQTFFFCCCHLPKNVVYHTRMPLPKKFKFISSTVKTWSYIEEFFKNPDCFHVKITYSESGEPLAFLGLYLFKRSIASLKTGCG